jgi:hypothetical protein
MSDTSWYPENYYIQPYYASYPVIHFYDLEDFSGRREDYWNHAWTRALSRWNPVGLSLKFFPKATCVEPGIVCSVVDVPPGIGAWTEFKEPPSCGFVQIDKTTWRGAVASRDIGYLTDVMTHEVGHVLGFGHGGNGIMASSPPRPKAPNSEEILAAKSYWGTF